MKILFSLILSDFLAFIKYAKGWKEFSFQFWAQKKSKKKL